MQVNHYNALANATKEFLAVAEQYKFCIDVLPDIKRRLYAESPFKGKGIVIDRKDGIEYER